MEDLDPYVVAKLFSWIATLEAEIATLRQIAEQDGRNSVADQCMESIVSLEKTIVKIALPLRQPPRIAWELLIKYGEQDMSKHDFTPAKAPTNGPYLEKVVARGQEYAKRRKT